MIYYINHFIGLNHLLISILLIVLIVYMVFYKDYIFIKQLLNYLLIFNILFFYIILFFTDSFNYKIHLPFHLCYITELGILISVIINNDKVYPWLILNSMFGGLVGFANSNLTVDSLMIEYIHYYISHFNLLLFTIMAFKSYIYISLLDFFKSITFNSLLMILIIIFNYLFNTNYWFTSAKPDGINFAVLLPEWPYYFFLLIILGLFSYSLTFALLINNRSKK